MRRDALHRGGSRAAFTMTELLIFGGLGVVVLGLCFQLFLGGTRRTVKVTRAQQDLLSIEATWERLLRDLRQAVPARPLDPELADQLLALDRSGEITFLVGSKDGPPRPVRWAFDGATGTIARDGDTVNSSRFAAVDFSHTMKQGVPFLRVRFVLPGEAPEVGTERVLMRVLSPPLVDERFPWSARLPGRS